MSSRAPSPGADQALHDLSVPRLVEVLRSECPRLEEVEHPCVYARAEDLDQVQGHSVSASVDRQAAVFVPPRVDDAGSQVGVYQLGWELPDAPT